MKRNLLSVSKFCQTNNTSIEFLPTCFLRKDLPTGKVLLQGPMVLPTDGQCIQCPHLLRFPLQVSKLVFKNGTRGSASFPSSPSSSFISFFPSTARFNCDPCQRNKSHRLPFGTFYMSSSQPLQLVYSDVWGPTSVTSCDGFLH